MAAASLVTAMKVIILVLLFAYRFDSVLPELYAWIRDLRLGEITHVSGDFYRVFLQSQFYSMITLLIFLPIFLLLKERLSRWEKRMMLVILIATSFTVLLGFSRSFWVGIFSAFACLYALLIFYERFHF